MALDLRQGEDDIVARVEALFPNSPRVYVTQVPDNVGTPQYPYAIVRFGSPVRVARDHHITNTRNDVLRRIVTVEWTSIDDASARDWDSLTRVSLTGYSPTDSGALYLEGGGAYSTTADAVKPTLYYRSSGFTYLCNLSWNE